MKLALVALASMFLAFSCAACVGTKMTPRTPGGAPRSLRTLPDQQAMTALVEVLCVTDPYEADGKILLNAKTGSAVLIDDTHALTASHVISCRDDFGLVVAAPIVFLRLADGRKLRVQVDREDSLLDLARVTTLHGETLGVVTRPVLGTAAVGDRLCTAFAGPERGGSCGEVLRLLGARDDGDVVHSAATAHGNSGGGAYVDGHLVGIVTDIYTMADGTTRGGASSLSRHADWF